jgi:7-carboxy-7-deazaguanine synthase
MFGQNEIHGRATFKDAGSKLLITSIFSTLQGEGPYQGRPALFVRTTYCSLSCPWCDTWFDSGDWFEINDLVEIVINKIKSKYPNLKKCGVVITGGEPSLQPNIAEFLRRCVVAGVAFTQIESNGILPIANLPLTTTLVVSPKCSEKTNRYLEPHAQTLHRADCLKFVITADETSPYHKIPSWAFDWQKDHDGQIYVSPMNMYRPEYLAKARQRVLERKQHNIDYRSTIDEVVSGWDDTILDRDQNMRNHQYAAQYAIDNGLWLTFQMQLYASVA